MAEKKAERVTILNQREGKFVLPPDPDELEKDPKAAPRVLLAGHSLEVSGEEAPKYLAHRGIVDASKVLASSKSSREKALEKQLADALKENAELKKRGGDDTEAELGDGDAVLTPAGDKGVIVKMKRKGKADVKLENGNVSEFAVKDLKPAPEA